MCYFLCGITYTSGKVILELTWMGNLWGVNFPQRNWEEEGDVSQEVLEELPFLVQIVWGRICMFLLMKRSLMQGWFMLLLLPWVTTRLFSWLVHFYTLKMSWVLFKLVKRSSQYGFLGLIVLVAIFKHGDYFDGLVLIYNQKKLIYNIHNS